MKKENQAFDVRWVINGAEEDLRAIPIDFLDGEDEALDALNARVAKILVATSQVEISFVDIAGDDTVAIMFSRRHPDVTISSTVVNLQTKMREEACFIGGARIR